MISIDELAKMTPVSPPIVNRNTNPRVHIMGVSLDIWELDIVAIQLNTLMPVGIAIIMVAAVK